jgi:2-iminoacetate synthase ThiH
MRSHAAVISALFALSALAHAQQPQKPTPEQMQSMMDASMVSMLPMLARISEVQIETQLKMAERPETAERIATFKKNLFDALRKKGFTAEQSLQILNSTALPVPPASGK